MIESIKYVRKPLFVEAVQVTEENFTKAAEWASGEIVGGDDPNQKYIQVRVSNPMNPRQSQARVGDWILYTPRGYKVYTSKAFHNSFELAEGTVRDDAIQAEKGLFDSTDQEESPAQAEAELPVEALEE